MEIVIKHRIVVDDEIADEIRWLNDQGVYTEGCCSGHGNDPPAAVIRPSSCMVAMDLGYKPIYNKHTGLYEIELFGDKFDSRFSVALDDGRVAKCWEAQAQSYTNCRFSTGLVEGIEPDAFYLQLERNGEKTIFFFRPDELQMIIWLCSGALWSSMVQDDLA